MATNIPSKKSKSHTGSNNSSFAWEQMCIDVDAIDIFDSISYASQNQENLKAVSFLKLYIFKDFGEKI